MVTALDGKTLPDVLVKASGPVDREGQTDPSGLVNFQNMSPGTYRVRFEHDEFVTFEKEVSLAAGKPLRVNAALSAAPPPPPPPTPEPVAPSPVAVPDGTYQPSSVAILELLDKNFIGTAPSKRSPLGCTASSTSTFVQTRESSGEHVHSDTDEILYVLSGEATHRIGGKEQAVAAHTFLVIPRGIPHSLTRKGRNPLTMVSIMSGQPCQADKQ
jgi:mannose-6-phosphate isomerase-like protein (cupin superfamily)